METTVSPLSCDEFIWNQSTKVRCFTCGVPRGEHVGGYISTRPSDPAFDAYLSQPCDDCESTATHNGSSSTKTPCGVCAGCRYGRPCERPAGKRGKFCNVHTDFDKYAHARND